MINTAELKWIRFVTSLLIVCAVSVTAFAQENVYLRAESKMFERMPLIIQQTTAVNVADEKVVKEFTSTLQTDLWYSNVIEPLTAANRISDDAAGSGKAAKFYLETQLKGVGEELIAEYAIMEVGTDRPVARNEFRGCRSAVRLLAHWLVDDLVFQLTGENGIAKTRICFVTSVYHYKEIGVVDYDGHNKSFVTQNRELNLTPEWTIDGQRIIFTSYKNQNPDLFDVGISDKKEFAFFSSPGLETSPAVSPDGKEIAFVSTKDGNAEIYVVSTSGRNLRRLTNHGSIDTSPDWSPDGREIVFSSDRTGKPQIYTMNSDGSNQRRLPVDLAYCDSPVWSPKGDRIAFVGRSDSGFDIFMYLPGTGEVLQLTVNQGSNEDPCWSPDGFQLAFSSTRDGGKRDIYTMFWDGSQALRLTFSGNCSSPSWSPNFRNSSELSCE